MRDAHTNMGCRCTSLLMLLMPCAGNAMTVAPSAATQDISVIIDIDAQGMLRVEAKDVPWERIFKVLSKYTGLQIHYSVLPEKRVNAICSSGRIEKVLSCLTQGNANMIFGYSTDALESDADSVPNEVWVVGIGPTASEAATADDAVAPSSDPMIAEVSLEPSSPAPHTSDGVILVENVSSANGDHDGDVGDDESWANALPEGRADNAHADTSTIPMLIDRANSPHEDERAQAMARLAIEGGNDPGVRAALDVALNDASPEVRAQAVHALALRKDGPAAAALDTALRDESTDVRLMVVDSAGNDFHGQALLRRALSDADETVRELAVTKLQEFARTAPPAPSTVHE